MAQAAGKLAHHGVKIASSGTKPNVLKEIYSGIGLGLLIGSFWKIYHINSRRKVEDFFSSYEKGEITVVTEPRE